MKINKILIANRGEIALRILRTCRQMGIRSVAVYSDADRDLPFVRQADEAVSLGAPAASESYLNAQKIVATAIAAQCDAIHPGYGFLSENADFADAVHQAGLVFIGPAGEAMRRLGYKTSARKLANSLGIPTLEGTIDPVRNAAECRATAEKIGYPIILKAAGGGGGKGMRTVYGGDDIESAFSRSRSEAVSAFGDDRIFVERYLKDPRHIEVQMLTDMYEHSIHLGERECSIQRRHQKIIEESPSTIIDDTLRDKLVTASVKLMNAAKYTGAGTVEFILDQDGNYFFLEVNTRLQVEHPVTELRTGIDLVREQIRISSGEHIQFRQEEVDFRGHSLECRICAEDSQNSFFPSTGQIVHMRIPAGAGIRVDCGFVEGNNVTPYYDSLIAKLITLGSDRSDAISKMLSALDEYEIFGIRNNIDLCSWIIRHPSFINGDIDTNFLQKHFKPELLLNGFENLQDIIILSVLKSKHYDVNQKFIPAIAEDSRNWKNQHFDDRE